MSIGGSCVGAAITYGHVASKPIHGNPVVGAFKNGTAFMGVAPADLDLHDVNHMLNSNQWLVVDGKAVCGPQVEAAPRTAAVIWPDGLAGFVVIDGAEIVTPEGPDLLEFARILASMGVKHAVNLDGGGSTTFVVREGANDWQVRNIPTCADKPVECQRAVGSAFCAM